MKNKKDLLNPTPAQIKWRNRKWAEALQKSRKVTKILYDGKKRCCLGVACDVANKLFPNYFPNAKGQIGVYIPNSNIGKFFGWAGKIPKLKTLNGSMDAARLNDREGKSHKQIAECVMNTFVHPKKTVWKLNS